MQIFTDKTFENPIEIIEAFDNKSFKAAFEKIEKYKTTHFLLGYIRYEAKDVFLGKKLKSKLPLLYFEVYEEVKMQRCKDAMLNEYKINKAPQINYSAYKKGIDKIKKEIAQGNTYQVNYTYDYKVKTNLDGFELYKNILPNQKTPYNTYIKNQYEEILSFSPELFFEIKKNLIKTKPMKGTIKRGETAEEDSKNIDFLKNDIKNRAENVMIVDLLRNDLGKIAKTGTVKVDKLFEIETHKTVHQMTSEISAELEENTTLYKIFEALFPCGSVTGAPKINTMEIIDNLEMGKRNIYCGAIGLISPEKTVFSVPIRILQKENKNDFYIYKVGGAIVWDSTAQDEWEETITKTKLLNTHGSPDYKLVETMRVENNEIKYKKEHLERMKKSAKKLGFKFNKDILNIAPPPLTPLPSRERGEKSQILRILLKKQGDFEIQYLPLNETKTNKILISKIHIQSSEKLLYFKTTHRPWYEKSLEKIKNDEVFDEIFFNENGELTEGARSNVVLQLDGKLYTPPIKCGLLNGILRQKLIKEKKVKEKKLYLRDIHSAQKIFCINSVRGVVEVELNG